MKKIENATFILSWKFNVIWMASVGNEFGNEEIF